MDDGATAATDSVEGTYDKVVGAVLIDIAKLVEALPPELVAQLRVALDRIQLVAGCA
jgi:hypothetical protein